MKEDLQNLRETVYKLNLIFQQVAISLINARRQINNLIFLELKRSSLLKTLSYEIIQYEHIHASRISSIKEDPFNKTRKGLVIEINSDGIKFHSLNRNDLTKPILHNSCVTEILLQNVKHDIVKNLDPDDTFILVVDEVFKVLSKILINTI